MFTQIFNDGSSGLITNVNLDYKQKKALEETIKGLEHMTEPEQVSKLIKKMFDENILNEFDLMELKNKGIYKEELTAENQREESKEQEKQSSKYYRDVTIGDDDEIDDLDL